VRGLSVERNVHANRIRPTWRENIGSSAYRDGKVILSLELQRELNSPVNVNATDDPDSLQ
jgi:hypothetical protein